MIVLNLKSKRPEDDIPKYNVCPCECLALKVSLLPPYLKKDCVAMLLSSLSFALSLAFWSWGVGSNSPGELKSKDVLVAKYLVFHPLVFNRSTDRLSLAIVKSIPSSSSLLSSWPNGLAVILEMALESRF